MIRSLSLRATAPGQRPDQGRGHPGPGQGPGSPNPSPRGPPGIPTLLVYAPPTRLKGHNAQDLPPPATAINRRPAARPLRRRPGSPHRESGYAVNGLMMVSPEVLAKSLTLRVANS